ncbi:MAG: lytic transglycosylase domain-containing protein [Xanthomonadales bacterium]|nr:lytic transglycosylase domain-containing protein [Xanthomonadales bacterium]
MLRLTSILLLLMAFQPAFALTPAQAEAFRKAYPAARSGKPVTPAEAATLKSTPLWPYLEFGVLTQDVRRQEAHRVAEWIRAHSPSLSADRLRRLYYAEFFRRGDAANFLEIWQTEDARDEDHCRRLLLSVALPGTEAADWAQEATALFDRLAAEPADCKPLSALMRARDLLTRERVQQRIDRAMAAKSWGTAAAFERDLPVAQQELLRRRLALVHAPAKIWPQVVGSWPVDGGTRAVLVEALTRSASREPMVSARHYAAVRERFRFPAAQQHAVIRELARGFLIHNDEQALRWLAELPADAHDHNLREWQVRFWLRRNDLAAARAAAAAMNEAENPEPRWRYVRARLAEIGGDLDAARILYGPLAREANWWGFLAADRIDAPYALCPLAEGGDELALKAVLAHPAVLRAEALWAAGFDAEARLEWGWAAARADAVERRLLGFLAAEAGRAELAIVTLSRPEDMRAYRSRFPILHAAEIKAFAERHGVDRAWMLGLIRAESAWNPRAHSSAKAMGLMQLIEGTARIEAKALGLPFTVGKLYEPLYNLELGSFHLSRLYTRHDGQKLAATAAYNAGSGAVRRWVGPLLEQYPDLWVEAIPYRETREYVPRVLAFSVIYDWRLDGQIRRLSARIKGMPKPAQREAATLCP